MATSIVFTVTTDLTQDQRMLRIADTLARASFEVMLVGRELPFSEPLEPRRFSQHRIACFFKKGALFYLEYNLRLLVWFLFRRFDVYGAVDADTALAGVLTSYWRRRPLVFDAHELFPEMPEVVHRKGVKKLWTWIEKLAFSRAAVAYSVSQGLVRYFEATYRRPVALIRNMPFRRDLPATTIAGQQYFIYQGALNVGRGLETAIEAMAEVPAQLLICGDGPLAGALKQLVAELQLQGKVRFTGNVAPPELALLTQNAFAGLMLLDNQGLSYYYSLANKFFDYVQAGIPQVCVPFPEYVALNAEYQVALLAQNKVPEVKNAMLTLLHQPATHRTLRQNCLRAREEWVWEQEGKKLVELYKNLA